MDPVTLTAISTFATVAGTGLSAAGAIQQGRYAEAAAEAEADALEQRADNERATASVAAANKAKEAQRLLSRQQAVAAASGGGATDPTVVDLMARTAGEGKMQEGQLVWEGQEKGRALDYQAVLQRAAGSQAELAGWIKAGSTILSSASTWTKYAGSGAAKPSDDYFFDPTKKGTLY